MLLSWGESLWLGDAGVAAGLVTGLAGRAGTRLVAVLAGVEGTGLEMVGGEVMGGGRRVGLVTGPACWGRGLMTVLEGDWETAGAGAALAA